MGSIFGKESVEEPPFTVLFQRDVAAAAVATPYEIRQYGTRMVAETTMEGSGENTGDAFRLLASYIGVFGKAANEGQKSIAMTAPVVMERNQEHKKEGQAISMTAPVVMTRNNNSNNKAEEDRIMQFMLPAEYDSMEKVPHPTNSAVRIKELPPAVGAVHRYAGSFSSDRSRTKATELYQQIQSDGLEDMSLEDALSTFQFWGYNPPFTLPMFRRNEVWIPLTKEQADALVHAAGNQKLN